MINEKKSKDQVNTEKKIIMTCFSKPISRHFAKNVWKISLDLGTSFYYI